MSRCQEENFAYAQIINKIKYYSQKKVFLQVRQSLALRNARIVSIIAN